MAFEFRFDNELSTQRGSSFEGTEGPYYAEELNVGTKPSVKYRRNAADADISTLNLGTLTTATTGQSYSFGANGVEVEEREFDGRALGKVFKLTYDYNVEDGWEFNGLKDGVRYKSSSNPETWEGMTFADILEDIVVEQCPGANFTFSSGSFPGGVNDIAPSISFRNATLTGAIEQVVQAYGNLLWWVESEGGTNWALKFATRDASGSTDVARLSGPPGQMNVIALDIEGPASDATPEAQVFSESDGKKIQVGGPGWGANEKVSTGNTFGAPPPIRYDLNYTLLDSIEANDPGFKRGNFGWGNLRGEISLFTSEPTTSNSAQEGYRFVQGYGDEKRDFQIAIPLADNDDTGLSITQWATNRAMPPGATGDFPAKPNDRYTGSPIGNAWEIVDDLLSHPDLSYSFYIGESNPPDVGVIQDYPYESAGEIEQFDGAYEL